MSEDERLALRDFEQAQDLTLTDSGTLRALQMCGTPSEAERCRKQIARAAQQAAARRDDSDYKPGLLGGTPSRERQ